MRPRSAHIDTGLPLAERGIDAGAQMDAVRGDAVCDDGLHDRCRIRSALVETGGVGDRRDDVELDGGITDAGLVDRVAEERFVLLGGCGGVDDEQGGALVDRQRRTG